MIVFAFPRELEKEAMRSIFDKVESIVRLTASNISSALYFEDLEYVDKMLHIVLLNEDAEYILLTDPTKNTVIGYNDVSPYFSQFKVSGKRSKISDDKQIISITTPVVVEEEVLGDLYIGFSLQKLNDRIHNSKLVIKYIGLFFMVLGVGLVYTISMRITAPLKDMVIAVSHISKGDFSARVENKTRDEVGNLAKAFNEMVVNLEVNTENLRKEIQIRKQTEKGLSTSLNEKEVLLKEVHHRVKNNLQIISSLLSLQLQHIDNQEIRNLFTESQTRVKSMALIHEKLYQDADLARINFNEYLKDLTDELRKTYCTSSETISINVVGSVEILLDIEAAIPCGLIVNELFTNSLKYAFPSSESKAWKGRDRPSPGIQISFDLSSDGEYVLIFRDNGIGIPEGFNLQEAETLGLKMVSILTTQLHGGIETSNQKGTEIKISFHKVG